MVDVRLYFDDDRVGERFHRGTVRRHAQVLAAVRQATQRAEQQFLQRARAQITSAGNFGARWTEGLRVTRSEGGGSIRIDVTHDIPYFSIHQTGGIIKGNPLLWIPLSFASDAIKVRARDYPGRLFRVDRAVGAPLLLSADTGEPKYSGHRQVRIPKRFRVIEIAREVMGRMRDFYNQARGRT